MASDPFLTWANRTVLRAGREEPYLSIQDIVVFVRDLEVSKRFYVDQLGFELITEQILPNGVRWIEVAPPDGSANLALVEPKPDRPEYKLIGGLPLGTFYDGRRSRYLQRMERTRRSVLVCARDARLGRHLCAL